MAQQIQDDGFHEIQLNGKQLVFLFMAATVVSVVIFLCGVLVGRGVRAQLGSVAENTPVSSVGRNDTDAAADAGAGARGRVRSDDGARRRRPPTSSATSIASRSQNAAGRTAEAGDRGAKAEPREHRLPRRRERRSGAASCSGQAAPEPAAPPAPRRTGTGRDACGAPAPAASSAEPAGQGFAVQIAALNVRSEADAIAKRLSSKGYAAYVLTPANGTPSVFRVRVGKFKTRREAENVAAKLQKEEQFKPWVTR